MKPRSAGRTGLDGVMALCFIWQEKLNPTGSLGRGQLK
ncbi:hypothetical protein Z950_2012 [Sulfitobacter mediterraneus KCTC 32188]|nr:hypothetical protein Z950_2012 [Sulfitobacter mediterraneus KCTC 32188]